MRSWAREAAAGAMQGARRYLPEDEHIEIGGGCLGPVTKEWEMSPTNGGQPTPA